MALSKKERSQHHASYHAHMQSAKYALSKGSLGNAIASALKACEFAAGMIQFERKEQDASHDTVESVEFVLNYAPIVFDFESIQLIDTLLQANRGLERNTESSLRDKLQVARDVLETNRRLWNRIESSQPASMARLAREFDDHGDLVAQVVEWWKHIGLLREIETTDGTMVEIVTNMAGRTQAKCSACGAVARAPKRTFLQSQSCPRCSRQATFVLIPTTTHSQSGI